MSDERVARPHAVERGERCQPRMSAFTINLYQPRAGVTDVAVELARLSMEGITVPRCVTRNLGWLAAHTKA